jgi:hypothetical protein
MKHALFQQKDLRPAMSPHRKRELARTGAALAALLVAACGGGVPAADGSARAGAPSSAGPAGAPAGGDSGDPQAPGNGPASPSDSPRPPGDGTSAPPGPTDTSGWQRDGNGNLIGPPGW